MPGAFRRRARALSGAGAGATAAARASGRDALDLPDASANRAQGAGLLSDLRHGAGADDADGRSRQSRTARYDPAVLDQPRAFGAAACHGDGRAFSETGA